MNSIVASSFWEILLRLLGDFSDASVENVDVSRCRSPACCQESVGQLQLLYLQPEPICLGVCRAFLVEKPFDGLVPCLVAEVLACRD